MLGFEGFDWINFGLIVIFIRLEISLDEVSNGGTAGGAETEGGKFLGDRSHDLSELLDLFQSNISTLFFRGTSKDKTKFSAGSTPKKENNIFKSTK